MKTPHKNSIFVGIVVLSWMLLTSSGVWASPVFDTTDYITGLEGQTYRFATGPRAGRYEATLSDLSFGPLAFDYLGLSIATAQTNL